MSKWKFLSISILFIALTGWGLFYLFGKIEFQFNFIDEIMQLSLLAMVFILISSISVYLVDVYRFKIFAKMLNIELDFKLALHAVIVNLFFGWITPGAAMGAPASIYVLGKNKIPWDAAFLICYGKSVSGFAFLLFITFVLIFLGYTPIHSMQGVNYFLASVFLFAIVFLALPLIGSFYLNKTLHFLQSLREKTKIGFITKLILGIELSTRRLNQIFHQDKKYFLAAIFFHLLYFISFIAPAVIVCVEFGAELLPSTTHGIIYTALAYSAPTPGGAGISEASSLFFYKDLLPMNKIILLALICRGFTFYIQILVGIIYYIKIGGFQKTLKSLLKIKEKMKNANENL